MDVSSVNIACSALPVLLAGLSPTASPLEHETGEVRHLTWTQSQISPPTSSPQATEPCRVKVSAVVLGACSGFLGAVFSPRDPLASTCRLPPINPTSSYNHSCKTKQTGKIV